MHALADRYERDDGEVFLTGVQALVRSMFDQRRADRRAGLRTEAFVSGYQGSPLGGLDIELTRQRATATGLGLHHVPGLNEELAATAVMGSQLAAGQPSARVDGVAGYWYGKAPGLDRATDAIRHANAVGTGSKGGVLALVGDDPTSKSSTLPSASEGALADLGIPTLYPASVQDTLDFGLHGIACSRASGLWSALKVVTDVADGSATVLVGPQRVQPVMPAADAGVHVPDARLLPPTSLDLERSQVQDRLVRAAAYARDNDLNRLTAATPGAWLGIVAAGQAYAELHQAFEILGLTSRDLDRIGVRVLKVGMIWPLEPEAVRAAALGVDELLVIEDKRPFLETQAKEILYGPRAPRLVGKRDELGLALLPETGAVRSDVILPVLLDRLERRVDVGAMRERLAERTPRSRIELPLATAGGGEAARTPYFCSGCPHNASTAAPDGTLVGAGIGCHTMVVLHPAGKGDVIGTTQMGGEGAQWIGMAPFVETPHFVQNLGDGTFHHSGSLAIRAAVAAGADITYKLLYNEAVAMTGGQAIEGGLKVAEITRLLEAEGVVQTIVTTEDLSRYRGLKLAANASVRARDGLADAQAQLAATKGVTVLIHDQRCAAEARRLRKRGKLPRPEQRVVINERVCEGCGDCGRKSSCLSVQPVETEFGRKTQIHQASCNQDFSCLDGDCPSFVTVVGGREPGRRTPPAMDADLPDPVLRVPATDVRLRMPGVGGTGVVTISQIIGMAALVDGRHVAGLDQTGLSQKAGPVVSDLRISAAPVTASSHLSPGSADVLLAFDLLAATTPANLAAASPGRTVAVVSTSAAPTAAMITDPDAPAPQIDRLLRKIARETRADETFAIDAGALAMALFDDDMPANAILLGAAWQHGCLPLSLPAIEEAFALNGVAVEKNLLAFAWGRAAVAAPELVARTTAPPEPPHREPHPATAPIVEATGARGELERLLLIRVDDLIGYGGEAAARRYVEQVTRVLALESARVPGGEPQVTEAVARGLHKLMTPKDEYEVARLHLDAAEQARMAQAAGEGGRIYWNLHPPVLRALGMQRKLKLGAWFRPAFVALRAGRRLRNTPVDPFGYAHVRRVERTLAAEYLAAVDAALEHLTPATQSQVAALADLPDLVRGYEQIKLGTVGRYRTALDEALSALAESDPRSEDASTAELQAPADTPQPTSPAAV